MANEKYAEVKKLRASFHEKMEQLQPEIETLYNELSRYYELMRFENLGCSSKEYELLYDGLMYQIEEFRILGHLLQLTTAFNAIKKEEKNP